MKKRIRVAFGEFWFRLSNFGPTEIDKNPRYSLNSIQKMATSVVKNSIFRGFFEKQNLTGPNFIDWYRKHRIVLSVDDKLDYLEQPISPAPVPAQAGQQVATEALAAHVACVK
nr:hypothetical protein [Tanacetum cinerariifolium]